MPLPPSLTYILPPLLGGFIGYVTNHIAIRMLFRPLRPWRIFGLRVPLTPGIIPSKRGELAARMGDMVGSHLLTAEDVGRTLTSERFRREFKGAVSEKLGQFLDRDLGPLESLVPEEFRQRFRELSELLRWKLLKSIYAYLDSDAFADKLEGYLQRQGEALLSRDLESFLTPERYQRLRSHVDARIVALLQSPALEREVGAFIDAKSEQILNSPKSLRELLPDDLIELLLAQIDKEIPPLLEKFGGMMYDPAFRARLVEKGKQGVESFLDSLGGLSGLLAGFINLDKIYDRIPEFLDQAGDEIARWLREEKTQSQVATMLRERLDGFLDRPVNSYVQNLSYDKVAGVRRFVRVRLIETMRSPRTAQSLMAVLETLVDRLKDRSFASLLESALPQGGFERLQQQLKELALTLLRDPRMRSAVEELIAGQINQWLQLKPLGRLSARLPADLREELEEGLYRQLTEILKKEVPPLVEALNVQKIVEEKVNGLDLLQVEDLLMGIMKEQFRYINLFGALLGFGIGLLNLVLLLL
ncbi:MAG: DUF445 domain-containing protein [Desulfuromonas sp.]|nr:MAG: DUF445 domain-containing protein [Desulfuromonas sp.]